MRPGPLAGLRIVEIAALGPVTHAMMTLADLGADVVRVARPQDKVDHAFSDVQDDTLRGRRQIRFDLKSPEGRAAVLDLVAQADVLVEGFRPGVMERLGLGPEDCQAVNPSLVYARMTGWGQSGPMAQRVGHDINYLSLTGALNAIGDPGRPPTVPLNLVGDFGGGSMYLVTGILTALWERSMRGVGSVLDVAMVDGIAALQQPILSMRATGGWVDERGANLIDGGAPFYRTYECSDGRFVAVGALEPAFYDALLSTLGLDDIDRSSQYTRETWPDLGERLGEVFRTRERDEWARVFGEVEACVTPVLGFDEAARHPHLVARGTFSAAHRAATAVPAPRFDGEVLPVPDSVVDVDLSVVFEGWRPTPS